MSSDSRCVSSAVLGGYTLLVAFLSLRPADGVAPQMAHVDKVFHCLAYLFFFLLASRLCRTGRQLLLAALSIVIFGVLMELGQSMVPGRQMSILDVVANTVGVLLAVVLVTKWHGRSHSSL